MDKTKPRLIVGTVLVSLIALALSAAPAFAVHDQDFELEGNVANDGAAVNGNNDWVDLFSVSGNNVPTQKANLPAGFGIARFFRDFKLKANGAFDPSDDSTFATGSKDTLNPGPVGGNAAGWQCSKSNNLGNTVDIMNAYAASYVDPVTTEQKVYFAMEVNGAGGSGSVGFWFMKDGSVSCVPGQQATNFTGNHTDGDILIVAEFTGQRVSFVGAYKWIGGAGGSLNQTAISTGGDCKDAGSDDICATVNSSDTVGTTLGNFTPPWLTQTEQSGAGEGTDLDEKEFFEGGISLTNTGLTGCFSTFIANTRTSASLTSTIFDYKIGSFPLCGISANKQCTAPSAGNPNPVIDPADSNSFLTKFDVTINSTGGAGATVFDVTLEEDSTFGAGESCKIINISGCASAPSVPINNFHNGTPVQVCDQLVNPITVRIECDTAANGFINSVTARAATSDGGTKDVTASDTMTQAEACTAIVSPQLSVQKICHDPSANHDLSLPAAQASHPANPKAVDLVYQGGTFDGFGVDVFVQIENTGNFKLQSIQLSDNPVLTFNPVTITQGTSTHTATTFNGELLPGQKAYFTGSYVADAPDNGQTDPCVAVFTDTVSVTASTSQGQTVGPVPDTASCPLCVCQSGQ